MPEVSLWWNMRECRLAFCRGEEVVNIQRFGCHGDLTFAPDPLRARTVRIKLHAVIIGIAEIDRFTNAVVRSALDWMVASHKPLEGMGKVAPRRITNGQMVKSGRFRWTRRGVALFTEHDHRRTVSCCRNSDLASNPLHDPQSERAGVKAKRAFKIAGAQAYLADVGFVWKKGTHGQCCC